MQKNFFREKTNLKIRKSLKKIFAKLLLFVFSNLK